MKVFVKYCGGCNPRYDRAAFVQKIEEKFLDHVFSETYDDPDISLIVCGCSSACAEKQDAAAPYGVLTVWDGGCIDDTVKFISEAR